MRLQPQVLPPTNTRFLRAALVVGAAATAAALGGLGVLIVHSAALVAGLPIPADEDPGQPASTSVEAPVTAAAPVATVAADTPEAPVTAAESPVAADEEAAPTVDVADFAFVFTAGGASWLRLDDAGEEDSLPDHGRPRLTGGDDPVVAIAAVTDAALPAELRPWKGRRVLVDGTCSATVTGFAVIARLVGDPVYAGEEGDGEQWTAATAFDRGARVLAARLDRCTGSWARVADRPPAALPVDVDAPTALAAARADLLASSLAVETQGEWRAAGQGGDWRKTATVTGRVVRHPVTGVTWAIVHARLAGGCGDPDASLAGVYRVDDGTVARIAVKDVPIDSIEQLLDIDGDGRFEMLGRSFLGLDLILLDGAGADLDTLELPFYGCPC